MAHAIHPSVRFGTSAVRRRDKRYETLWIKSLLHPTERSRLALALTAIFVAGAGFAALLVAAGGLTAVAVRVAILVITLASIWLGVQIHRAHMLGQSVRVTRRSLPEVQDVLDQVRDQLDYHRPIDVYVAAKLKQPAMVQSYLGTKMILIEGSLIGDLLTPERRSELTFLLARYVGAFKARHTRFDLLTILISAVHQLRALNLFLNPYYRATSYSGDQIALACCGDLGIGLTATERLLSGREVAPTVAAPGVIDQAKAVTHRIVPRIAQLFTTEPHLTNRYLNLLFYAKAYQPGAWGAFLTALDSPTAAVVDGLSARSPHVPNESSRQVTVAETQTDAVDAEDVPRVDEWESDAGVIGSSLFALLAAGLFAWATFATPGSLKLFGAAVLAVDAVLVAGLVVAGVATLVWRRPVFVALTALASAALAGWTWLLPALDIGLDEYAETSLSTWLQQGASLAALVAALGLTATRGRLATLMERRPTRSSRLFASGAVAGGLMIVGASFLPIYGVGADNLGLWEANPGIYDVLQVVIGAGVIGVAIAAATLRGITLPWLALIMSCIAFFFVFTPSAFNEDYSLQVGWWLALGGAAVALACAAVGWLSARPARTAPA